MSAVIRDQRRYLYHWKSKYGGMEGAEIRRFARVGRRRPSLKADVYRSLVGE